jgi:ubiquitin thioesterase protein OTUB1
VTVSIGVRLDLSCSLDYHAADRSLSCSALAFAYLQKILHAKDRPFAVQQSLSILDATLQQLDAVGFERLVFEDFHAELAGLVRSVYPPEGSTEEPLDEHQLLKQLQRPEGNSPICSLPAGLKHLHSSSLKFDRSIPSLGYVCAHQVPRG